MNSLSFTVATSCLSLIFGTSKFVMPVTKPTLKMQGKKSIKKLKEGKVYFNFVWISCISIYGSVEETSFSKEIFLKNRLFRISIANIWRNFSCALPDLPPQLQIAHFLALNRKNRAKGIFFACSNGKRNSST